MWFLRIIFKTASPSIISPAQKEWVPAFQLFPTLFSPQVNNKNNKCILKEDQLQKQQKYTTNQDLLMSCHLKSQAITGREKIGGW